MVYYVVATRCEIDINGFSSVYEQDLSPSEVEFLARALERLGEGEVAVEFRRGLNLLADDGFYDHKNWNHVSPRVRDEIEAIGERVDNRLWLLDERLAALLDEPSGQRAG